MDPRARALLQRYIAGDDAAFAELWAWTVARLTGWALQVAFGDTSVVDDAFQDTALAVVRHRGTLDPAQNWLGWVRTTLRNNVVNQQRARAGFPTVPLPDEGPADDSSDPEDDSADVRACLARLGERDRRVLALRFVAGMRQCRMARVLGVANSTVTNWLTDALVRLRAELLRQDSERS